MFLPKKELGIITLAFHLLLEGISVSYLRLLDPGLGCLRVSDLALGGHGHDVCFTLVSEPQKVEFENILSHKH